LACIASLTSFLVATPAGAASGTGADLLLQGTRGAGVSSEKALEAPHAFESSSNWKLDDPFAIQLYSTWQAAKTTLSPEVNHWVALHLKQDFEGAAHLWGGIEKQVPTEFVLAAQLAHLRALFKLGAFQWGVESWMRLLSESSRVWSKPGVPVALVSAFEASWPQWSTDSFDEALFSRGFEAPPEVMTAFLRLDPRSLPSIATLQAAAWLRKGDQGRTLLDVLPARHAYRLPLAQTVALGLAKKRDLAGAASVLKIHAEKALEAEGNLTKVSGHLLQIARFLFQAGLWEEAEIYYRKIPNSAHEFLSAREELAWVLLRRGEVSSLRGELASLSTPATREQFHPEIPVVRAISNLKLCSYGGVQKDFAEFQTVYGGWAKRIDQALSASSVPAPSEIDAFSTLAEKRERVLEAERARLAELQARSVASSLPSVVGQQSHWKLAESALAARTQWARQAIQSEYRRQWRAQKVMLEEAIRKMRFVKIELLNQLRGVQLAAAPQSGEVRGAQQDQIRSSQSAPLSAERSASAQNELQAPAGKWIFPVDGVFWPDEFFRVQGLIEARCLKGLER
jgi:tetratricopeptide (TPR) repeat protein